MLVYGFTDIGHSTISWLICSPDNIPNEILENKRIVLSYKVQLGVVKEELIFGDELENKRIFWYYPDSLDLKSTGEHIAFLYRELTFNHFLPTYLNFDCYERITLEGINYFLHFTILNQETGEFYYPFYIYELLNDMYIPYYVDITDQHYIAINTNDFIQYIKSKAEEQKVK